MARHPTARRTHRDPDSTGDDAFIERVLETSAWARENRTPLLAGLVVVTILLAGFLIYRSNTERLRTRAAIEILQVRQSAQMGNPAVTIRDAETFLQTFGGTPTAIEARLLLGQAYLESNQPDQALEAVRDVGNLRSPSGVSAAMLEAAAHEAATRYDEAERVLLRVASGAEFDYQQVAALDNLARIRAERGNAAGAVEAYDRILQTLPEDSPDRPVFAMRRAEAQSAAASPRS